MTLIFTLAEPSGGGSALDALGINGLAFISQLISFIIVLVLLGKFVIPRILQTLDKRQAVIREGIENAEKARQDWQRPQPVQNSLSPMQAAKLR